MFDGFQFATKRDNEQGENGFQLVIDNTNKYFELKNSWGANGAPQTRTTC